DPQNSGTLYAAVSGSSGIFKSTDGGMSWTNLLKAPASKALAIDPQDGRMLYAATYRGVFKTTNGGADWIEGSSPAGQYCCGSLAIDPQDPDTIYGGGDYGVFRSTDGGASWTNTGLPLWEHSNLIGVEPSAGLAVDPQNSGTVYAATPGLGIFKS